MTSDTPTEEALYGDLDVSREGDGASERFRLMFRPIGRNISPAAGCAVDSTDALDGVLRALQLTEEQIGTLHTGLKNSPSSWVRILAPLTALKRSQLI